MEGDSEKGFKLTDRGTKLVSSTINEKSEDVKKALLEIIENSHLNDLKDFIETEGDGITKLSLFSFVKDRGNIADGDRFGNMPAVYSSGTIGLLELFDKAGLIPQNTLSKPSPNQKHPSPKSPNQKHPSPKSPNQKHPSPKSPNQKHPSPKLSSKTKPITSPPVREITSSESHNLQSNIFSISINKKIEKDEFDLVKSQITGFLQFVEKKLSNPNTSTN